MTLVVISFSLTGACLFIRRKHRQSESRNEKPHGGKPDAARARVELGHEVDDHYCEHKPELPGNKLGIAWGQRYRGKPELGNAMAPAEVEQPAMGEKG